MFNRISVVGLGYIGLPTAAVIANTGIKVIGVDVNQTAVDTINQGKIHIIEPGLELLVKDVVGEGNLLATLSPLPADAFLIAVPTPFKGDHEPDLSYIHSAIKSIAPVLVRSNLIILESTSPVGTTEKVARWIAELRPDLSVSGVSDLKKPDILVSYCPERVLPGQVIEELRQNDRIIGGLDAVSTARAIELYKTFVDGDCIATSAKTAEMTKLTENASRDVQIAFANELSLICDKQGIDVWELISLANRHPRVNILQPGCGVGGHCIAVDPWFIINKNPKESRLITSAREINNHKPRWVVQKVQETISDLISSGYTQSDLNIAIMGLAFKPDIDDLRESPAVEITRKIASDIEAKVLVVEPNINQLPKELDGIELFDFDSALDKAQIVLMLVAHSEFKEKVIDREKIRLIDIAGVYKE